MYAAKFRIRAKGHAELHGWRGESGSLKSAMEIEAQVRAHSGAMESFTHHGCASERKRERTQKIEIGRPLRFEKRDHAAGPEQFR